MTKYIADQGDCIESIAFDNGFFWETIWNNSQNAELKQKRQDPNVLFQGDEIFIPDKQEKTESGATEQKHRFKRKGVPSQIWIVLKDDKSQPRAGLDYVLEIDDRLIRDRTNSAGQIRHSISPNAREGRLIIGKEGDEIYILHLGNIDPITEISGIQSRLKNLGFYEGSIDGKMNSETVQAIKDFQTKYKLEANGNIDQDTRDMIKNKYGC